MSAERAISYLSEDVEASVAYSNDSQAETGSKFLLSGDFAHLQHAKIMMVDDELITMRVLQSFLEAAGYSKFDLVSDSVSAIEEIRKKKPDVLLLDVMMPEVSGFDILALLRNETELSHIPVIILTSSSDAETKLKALDLGATDFLAKPVDPSELSLRVRNTLAAKAYQDQLTYYDALTHLPNSHLFGDRMSWATTRAKREGTRLTLLHLVFDSFKRVVDTLGPKTGDNVLKQIATRLNSALHEPESASREVSDASARVELFRLVGSDFSVLFSTADGAADVSAIGTRILEIMKEPLDADGTDVYLEPSIGVASFPDDASDTTSLFKLATGASSQASTHGGGRLQFYSAAMNERSLFRMRMEAKLRKALSQDEFKLLYQPKIEVKTGRITGTEALIRWYDSENGFVSPADFIPIAEEAGLILPIGEWVLREACSQMVQWRKDGIELKMSVNISARQFFEADIVTMVRSVLAEHKITPSTLVLELTESILVDEVDTALNILSELRGLGVQISIDDFGTGYSSLSYLKMFQADEVKIDRAFITDVTTSRDDQALVYAVTYLAHEMGFRVCAEGVEDSDQCDYLKSIECDEYQGYYFSRPVLPMEVAMLWRKQ